MEIPQNKKKCFKKKFNKLKNKKYNTKMTLINKKRN